MEILARYMKQVHGRGIDRKNGLITLEGKDRYMEEEKNDERKITGMWWFNFVLPNDHCPLFQGANVEIIGKYFY